MELQVVNGCWTVLCKEGGVKHSTVVDFKREISQNLGVEETAFYLTHGGKAVRDQDIPGIYGPVTVVPRILGGKGGFGSMLRAIGAQIEKTTNRDACRDLSGRRLRDINEEQRLKRWFAKQGEREQEKKEARKRKLEKLKQFTEGPPLPVIDDPQYNQQRADMADSVHAAVDKGFEADVHGKASGSATVTTLSDESSSSDLLESKEQSLSALEAAGSSAGPSNSNKSGANSSSGDTNKKKTIKKLMMDEDFDSCSSSDESVDEESSPKKAKLL